MRLKKIGAALSAVTAAAVFTTAASAYIEVPAEKSDFLNASADSWRLSISSSYGVDYTKMETVRAVIEITDEEAYRTDKENGFYSDGETAFADFTGVLAFGGAEWLQFNVASLADTDAGTEIAEIRALGDGKYLLTAYLPEGTEPSPLLSSISLAEWGNRSPDYSLRILSFGLYAEGLEPIVVFGADGEQIDPPEIVIPDGSEEEPEETTEPEEEQPEETAETEEMTSTEAETQPEETAAPAETAEQAEETAAPGILPETVQTQGAPPAQAMNPDSFASRDSGLMIVLIAAGALVVIALVGIIIVSLKKRK